MKTFQYNIMKVRDNDGNYIEFPSIAQKDPITLKANLTTTQAGYALDASQGYALDLKKFDKTGGTITGRVQIEDYKPVIGVRSTDANCFIEGGMGVEPTPTGPFGVVAQAHDGTGSNYEHVSLLFYPKATDLTEILQFAVQNSTFDNTYTILHSGNANSYIYQYIGTRSKDTTSLTATSGGWGNVSGTQTSLYQGGHIPLVTVSSGGTYCYLHHTNAFQALGCNACTYTDSTGATKTNGGAFGITLGNATNYVTANGYRGFIRLYSHLTYFSCLYSTEAKANRYIYLPTDSATSNSLYIAACSNGNNAGSASRPVYVSGSVIKECDLSVVCSSTEPTSKHTGMIWLKPVS